MKHGVISFSSAILLSLVAAPLVAWADAKPDFDDDAKPILRMQPGLLQYVESRFDVKDTGTAKFPGDDDRRPGPPYIFRARPMGSNGPYNLRLLIQPGQPGHILGVVDITKVHLGEPGAAPTSPVANQAPPAYAGAPNEPQVGQAFTPSPQGPVPAPQEVQPAPTPAPAPEPAPAPSAPTSDTPSGPTADTPSGPIMGSSSSSSSASPQSSLAPPPDPAPSAQ
jgi:hypothetical protein